MNFSNFSYLHFPPSFFFRAGTTILLLFLPTFTPLQALPSCPNILGTSGLKLVVDSIRFNSKDSNLISSDYTELRIEGAIKRNIANLHKRHGLTIVFCNRWPKNADFTLDIAEFLNDNKVLIELWGFVEPQEDVAMIRYLIVPLSFEPQPGGVQRFYQEIKEITGEELRGVTEVQARRKARKQFIKFLETAEVLTALAGVVFGTRMIEEARILSNADDKKGTYFVAEKLLCHSYLFFQGRKTNPQDEVRPSTLVHYLKEKIERTRASFRAIESSFEAWHCKL